MIPPKEFIRKVRPFSFLTEDELDILISGLEVQLFKKDRDLFRRGEDRHNIYIVYSGLVCLLDEEAVDYLSRGEVLGLTATDDNKFLFSAKALEDTVCYLISMDRYKKVLAANASFSAFFTAMITKRFRSLKSAHTDEKILQESALVIDIERVIYRKPVVCRPRTMVKDAAARMDAENVSSVIAVDDSFKPVGILTHKDLRKVLISGGGFSRVSEFMSCPVKTISSRATVFEAFANLTEMGIDHLVVLKGEDLLGVITRKDIQIHLEPSFSIFALYRKVINASSIEALTTIFDSIRISVAKIALAGPDFFDLTKMISSVNDAIVVKVIEFLKDKYPDGEFVWLNMGSSGRKEEAIATDQDNALIYRGDRPLDLAKAVCNSLDAIGIPKCLGNYMAGNEMWNQNTLAWTDYFRNWFTDPVPIHVRYLSVFMDMRPLYGDTSIYKEVINSIGNVVTEESIRSLASDAVDTEIPLGLFGIRGLRKGLDIKMYGIYPIVNGVRALALQGGFFELTNTRERMSTLSREGIIDEEMFHDLQESYGFLQDLRLRHHARSILRGSSIDNLINTREISRLDLLILKESLKVVASFRKFLMKKFDITQPLALREL
jgi:CBS domain-containing protein